MISLSPLWWFALPLILLPIWWHRDKRERMRAQSLATARFLPASDPQQVRVWRWRDVILLIVRCLLLIVAIALLAQILFAWRSNTVFIAKGTDVGWVEQQVQEAHLSDAKKVEFCAQAACEIQTENIFGWLAEHQTEWRTDAKFLVLADAAQLPLQAQQPVLAQALEIRSKASALQRQTRHVWIKSERAAKWQTWLQVFAQSSEQDFVLDKALLAETDLVIWDVQQAPDAAMHAPLWWMTTAAMQGMPVQKKLREVLPGKAYQAFETAHGQVWTLADAKANPLTSAEEAKSFFEAWQSLQKSTLHMPVLKQNMKTASLSSLSSMTSMPASWRRLLLILLALLFIVERGLTHARRS